jgi:hypothetical protein
VHEFCGEMFDKMENEDDYLKKIDRRTSVGSSKLNVFYTISSVKVYGPFCFAEPTVTVISYLDMLENYFVPQLQQDMVRGLIFQQDGAPPHFDRKDTSYFNRTVIAWIERGGTIAWPPRSPKSTSLDFSVWRYVKDKEFHLTLPAC